MLVNGKEILFDQKASDSIQQKIDNTPHIPDFLKSELPNKERREVAKQFDDKSNSLYGDSNGGNFLDYSGNSGFGVNNNTFVDGGDSYQNRISYYNIFNEMAHTNFINKALQVVSDDACQKNEEGNTLAVYSDDEDIKGILEDLFHKRLNLNKELWSLVYETIKLGDNFYEVIPDSYDNPKEIVRIRYLDPYKVNRIERNGKLLFYTYTTFKEKEDDNGNISIHNYEKGTEEQVQYRLQPWQIIHFKVTDKDFYPYGGSLLKSGVRTFRRLSMLEDAILVYRLARVPERRVFKVDVANMSTNEANRYIQKVRDNYRTSQILDADGNINRKAAALSITQDVFIPVREGTNGTNVESLSGGQGLNTIDDLKYFRDQILMTLNIPPSYLGVDMQDGSGGQARGSLAIQDVKFARFVERVQYYIEEGMTKLAYVELFFKKKKRDELGNFKIELTAPSNMKEIMDIEYINQKMSLIQTMQGTNMFPIKYILKTVMRLSKKEINDIMLFKQLEQQQQQGGMGGDAGMMGGGGGMMSPMGDTMNLGAPGGDMGGGMPPPETGGMPPPDAGVLNQEKIINMFGKELLVENKEDFFKLLKIAKDWQEAEKNKTINEDDDEEIVEKSFVDYINKTFIKEHSKNNEFVSLFYEGEMNGLDYSKNEFKIYGKPRRKTGPRAKGDSGYLVEEILYRLKK